MRFSASSRGAPWLAALVCGASLLAAGGAARAAEAPNANERQLTPEEIDAWLDSRAMPKSQGERSAQGDDDEDAPPPPPRKKGFVLESSVGVLGEVGRLKHITPTAPWFGLRLGYEPLRMLMVFVDADIAVLTTSYAHPPPPPRSMAFWNFGGGIRLTLKPTDRFGIYVQGSVGAGRVTEDVLKTFGYQHADEVSYYQGAELGLEWYQVNPHMALTLHGGIRNYPRVLKRERDNQPTMAWLGGAGLRYTF